VSLKACLPWLGLMAATAAAAGPDALEDAESQQQALFIRLAPTVVYIANGTSYGSGFFVSPDGLILTNAHVVRGANEVDVALNDGKRMRGAVVERGLDEADVALVKVEMKDAPVPALSGIAQAKVGSWVGAIGHGRGAIWTFNTGMISNIYPEGSERPVFQTQIPLNPGNSGGPIFDRRGRVLGIVTAGIHDASSINFGVGMEVARRSLKKLGALCDCLVVLAPAGVPVFVDGVMAGTGPRVVIPVSEKAHEVFAVVGGEMKRAKVYFPETREVELK